MKLIERIAYEVVTAEATSGDALCDVVPDCVVVAWISPEGPRLIVGGVTDAKFLAGVSAFTGQLAREASSTPDARRREALAALARTLDRVEA